MHALITGASSGFGEELSRLFAANGHNLVLVARNQERLAALAQELQTRHSIQVKVFPQDLAAPGASVQILEELERDRIAISFLVNNAGFALHGPFAKLDLAQQIEMIQVNIRALVELTGRILPQMLQRGAGRILNVASTGAYQPGAFLAVYFASKAFVHSFSAALSEELRDSGVTVTTLCPGPSRTGFTRRAGLETSGLFSGRLMPVMEAATVAQAGYQGLMRGKRVVIPGWRNRLGVFLAKCSPASFSVKVVRMMNGWHSRPG